MKFQDLNDREILILVAQKVERMESEVDNIVKRQNLVETKLEVLKAKFAVYAAIIGGVSATIITIILQQILS